MRQLALLLLAASGLAVSGCVAGVAVGAVGAAVKAATPERPVMTEDRHAAARAACESYAARYGRVHLIDAEQRPDGRVTVWGTVQDDRERRAFRCRYDGEVSAFRLRAIPQR